MSEFITGEKLEDTVYDIIWGAKETLLIICPYIRLDDYFKRLFLNHKNNPELNIIIVFGKNEHEISRSLSKEDFDFFKQFLKISIVYAPSLHAKYYGNEKKGIITSINLHDHSFKHNIEFGVYTEKTIFTQLGKNLDLDAWDTCLEIAHNNDVVFINRPVYENKKFIINFSKNFIKSETLYDSTDYFYNKTGKLDSKKIDDFPTELELGSMQEPRPVREYEATKIENKSTVRYKTEYQSYGYCIRTGEKIPFNPKQPMTYYAWQIWNEYKNWDFKENYCHKTGRPSNGKTSMRNPILNN